MPFPSRGCCWSCWEPGRSCFEWKEGRIEAPGRPGEKAHGTGMAGAGPDIPEAHSADERAPLDILPDDAAALAGPGGNPRKKKKTRPATLARRPRFRLSIKYISSIYAARASQSSAVRRRRKRVKSCFPAACTSENTLPRPQVCEPGTQTKPSEAGLFGREGARERSEPWPSGRGERCGL